MDREKIIKAIECRKNADKRCGNPCEETGACHYAKAIRGLDGEIYRPFVCDRERICVDTLELLKEQESEKKRIMKVIWDTLHKGLSIDTVADQDWVYEQIRHKIEDT